MDSVLVDPGSERAVLSGLLSYGTETYLEVCDLLTPASFADNINSLLYKCVEKVVIEGNEIDLTTIIAAAEQMNLGETVGSTQNLEYLNLLLQYPPCHKKNVINFAATVKKYEFARNAKKTAGSIIRSLENITGDESIEELITLVEGPIGELVREDTSTKTPVLLGEDAPEYVEHLVENPCDQMGISTGYPAYDAAIGGGLRPKCVELISARPKTGKSVFSSNVALHVARQGIPVLLLDTEMSKEDQMNRALANMNSVEINDIATGKFAQKKDVLENIVESSKEFASLPIHYINISGEPIEVVLNIIKRWVSHVVGVGEDGQTKDCLVIYDYLKLTSGDSLNASVQEYQALGFQITSLHNLSVKYHFPCLALTQLNRDGITSESTAAISGSDRLIWLCTSFSIFKHKSDEEMAEDGAAFGNRKLVPVVCRHGPGMEGGNYINMRMDGQFARITELGTRDDMLRARESQGAIDGAADPIDIEDDE